jgi:acetyl-CoA synthetase
VPRRLGERRRAGFLVPARSQRRHDERRGQRLRPPRSSAPLAPRRPEAVVGVPDEVKGEAIWCFVVARDDRSGRLAEELSALVAEHLGKAFRPARVVLVPELPRTRSAKILRRAIRATVVGSDPGDLSSLENPSSLDSIRAAIG